jgi:N-methylhydantoinase A
MTIHTGIDIGGTFTDVVAREGEAVSATKVPSTPSDLVQGVQNGIEEIIQETQGDRGDVDRFVHGTTAGTNAVIEQNGGTVGLLMTDGFRDLLAIGRQNRKEMYDLFVGPQTPTFLAPREQRFDVKERIDADGEVITSLDEDQVVEIVDELVDKHDIDSIAICYLFSFKNPEHEKRTQEIVEERYPDLYVSRSSSVNPKFREYERLVVTAFDAYLKPVMTDYITRMEDMLDDEQLKCELQVMQSRGGITNADLIGERPVTTLLSGPAAAVSGAAHIGGQAGFDDLITLDMGGTSCDVSLIQNGNPRISSEGEILKYPLRAPLIDVNTIGSGGGSIAWIDETDSLHVGPESAGADPGPAAYDNGGTDPTVTDASVVLGYLNPEYFADGSFDLDVDAAEEAIRSTVVEPLEYDLVTAAKGIHNIVNTKMAEELRLITVKRGFDPRDFSLFAMGGAGPAHAAWLAEELNIPRVIVPPTPGVLSAGGLLSSDVEHDHEVTIGRQLQEMPVTDLEDAYGDLTEKGTLAMEREEVPLDEVEVTREADMRYVGQSFEIDVEIPDSLTDGSFEEIRERFLRKHYQVHGHKNEEDPVEVVNLRVVHTFTPEQLRTKPEPVDGSLDGAQKTDRKMHFAGDDDVYEVPVYQRARLPFGVSFDGPAVVEQSDSTTTIYPGQCCRVDEEGNLIIHTS